MRAGPSRPTPWRAVWKGHNGAKPTSTAFGSIVVYGRPELLCRIFRDLFHVHGKFEEAFQAFSLFEARLLRHSPTLTESSRGQAPPQTPVKFRWLGPSQIPGALARIGDSGELSNSMHISWHTRSLRTTRRREDELILKGLVGRAAGI